jgi:hypothetical protein
MEAYEIYFLSLCLYIIPYPLLGNGSVITFPRQRICTQHWKNCLISNGYQELSPGGKVAET